MATFEIRLVALAAIVRPAVPPPPSPAGGGGRLMNNNKKVMGEKRDARCARRCDLCDSPMPKCGGYTPENFPGASGEKNEIVIQNATLLIGNDYSDRIRICESGHV